MMAAIGRMVTPAPPVPHETPAGLGDKQHAEMLVKGFRENHPKIGDFWLKAADVAKGTTYINDTSVPIAITVTGVEGQPGHRVRLSLRGGDRAKEAAQRLIAQAREAMDEYRAAMQGGGDPTYPAWAADVLLVLA